MLTERIFLDSRPYAPTDALVAEWLELLTKTYRRPHALFRLSPDVILCGWLGLKHQLTN